MAKRNNFNIKAYLVVGPENTKGRDVIEIIEDAIKAGFTFIQIRSKEASARDLIDLSLSASDLIDKMGKRDEVALVVNDRLDVILAARDCGANIDGIHIGQSDIPVDTCRKYLGPDAIIGLSAETSDLLTYVEKEDTKNIDYFGAGPLRYTDTKPDCGLDAKGNFHQRSLEELTDLSKISKIPVVVGGGVKLADIGNLKKTGVDGFFVVSAVAGADRPYEAAKDLVTAWDQGAGAND